jgi:hypothetical protein
MAQENGLHNITYYWTMEAVTAPNAAYIQKYNRQKQCPVRYAYNE